MPSFLQGAGSFFQAGSNGPVPVAAPATGSTYTMRGGQKTVYFNHSATVAALTVVLPPAPANGDAVTLKFNQIVTALTIRNAAGAIVGTALTAAAQGQAVTLVHLDTVRGWIWW